MPRLLILCEFPTLLGGERSMLATLPLVRSARFEVHIAAPGHGPLADALREAGVPHIPWKTLDENGQRLPLGALRTDIANFVRDLSPQLLHANSLSMARIAGPVAMACGVPSIGHMRDIMTLSPQAITDVNDNRRLVAVSRATRDFLANQGIAREKCIVLYNGVNLDEFQPASPSGRVHQELSLPASVQLILTIGQLGPRKGMDVVLRAVRQIAATVPNAHWLIVGERTSNKGESREFEALLKQASRASPLAERVHFLGNRTDVAQLLNECVLLVHGARQEPLGRVLLEAAASGVAVVATDVGGTREIFPVESDSAMLILPNDEQAMSEALLTLLQNEQRRSSLAQAARRRAEAAFDIRVTAPRLIEQYERLLSE